MITRVKNIINGRKVSQIRHDHFMDRSELSLLVGIKESQLVALENETDNEFVDVDHRMDCARRIALFFGLPKDNFLQSDISRIEYSVVTTQLTQEKSESLFSASLVDENLYGKVKELNVFKVSKEYLDRRLSLSQAWKISFLDCVLASPCLLSPLIVTLSCLVFFLLN